MDNIDLSVASVYCGYLQKKSPSFFAGYQKRFFQVLAGKLLTYSDKPGAEVKGSVRIVMIPEIQDTDSKG
jgi:hypothetical protein